MSRWLCLGAALLIAAGAWALPVPETGWPFHTNYSVSPSAAADNLDADPYLEVAIASQDGNLYVLNHDGTVVPGWPQYLGQALGGDPWQNIYSSPAIWDINNDGQKEIIVGSYSGKLYVFRPNGSVLTGWPYNTGFMIATTPAIGDVDGDGQMEIVFGNHNGDVYAMRANGTILPGFPYHTPYVIRSSPALGDLDGDGRDEIVVTAENATYQLYVINGSGGNFPGFPMHFPDNPIGSDSSPALADVDHDGQLEIVVGDRSGYLHVLHSNGAYLPGWPLDAGYCLESSPTVANLDNDPQLEIIVGMNDSNVRVYNYDGTLMPGWPQTTAYTVISSASVGDVDGDGQLEIVQGCNTGDVYGWNVDGTPVPGFPLTQPTYTVYSSPLLADLDQDGHLEMVLGCNDTWIYCWDMGAGTYNPNLLPWPKWRHDNRNTGCVPVAVAPPNLDVTLEPINPPIIIPGQGGSFQFNASVLNNGPAQIPFYVWARLKNPDGTYTDPTLGPVQVNPPVGQTITRQRTQTVPGSWPNGVYTYLGYGNTTFSYPALDSSSFTWTKISMMDGGPWVTEAACTGEPFPYQTGGTRSVVSTSGSGVTPTMAVSPNPFNPSTAISYQLSAISQVSLRVYDISGRLISMLVNERQEAGTHQVTFDGSSLPSGVYLYTLQAGSQSTTGKMVLAK